MDHVGFEWRSAPQRKPAGWANEHGARAFQIDPGWYEAYWLTAHAARPRGVIREVAAAAAHGFWAIVDCVVSLRRAVGGLPSEAECQRAGFRISAFPTWFGGLGSDV
jgi:hypothetical protein